MKKLIDMNDQERRKLYKKYNNMILKEKLLFKYELYNCNLTTLKADEIWEYLNGDIVKKEELI